MYWLESVGFKASASMVAPTPLPAMPEELLEDELELELLDEELELLDELEELELDELLEEEPPDELPVPPQAAKAPRVKHNRLCLSNARGLFRGLAVFISFTLLVLYFYVTLAGFNVIVKATIKSHQSILDTG